MGSLDQRIPEALRMRTPQEAGRYNEDQPDMTPGEEHGPGSRLDSNLGMA